MTPPDEEDLRKIADLTYEPTTWSPEEVHRAAWELREAIAPTVGTSGETERGVKPIQRRIKIKDDPILVEFYRYEKFKEKRTHYAIPLPRLPRPGENTDRWWRIVEGRLIAEAVVLDDENLRYILSGLRGLVPYPNPPTWNSYFSPQD